MIRTLSAISVGLLVLVSFELYNGVHRVKAQEQELVALKAQMAREEEAIRVLKAEWTYLNQPDRLQALARRHLALAPTGASQIVATSSLPVRGEALSAPSRVIQAQDLPARIVTDVPLPRPKPPVMP
jgi:hypothetical protein